MTRLGFPEADFSACGYGYGTDYEPVASVSPDGRMFAVVVRRGDVQSNDNRYSLLIWNTHDPQGVPVSTILQMSSSSFEPAIDPASLSWSRDGRSVTFIGSQARQPEQIYEFALDSRQLRPLTKGKNSVESYSRDADGKVIVYETADIKRRTLWNSGTMRHGLVIRDQDLLSVTLGGERRLLNVSELFVADGRSTRSIRLLPGSHILAVPFSDTERDVSVSPDGKYAVVKETLPRWEHRELWRQYNDILTRTLIARFGQGEGQGTRRGWSTFSRYILVNLRTGRSRVLLDAPIRLVGRPVVWSPDSRTVILSRTLLPLEKGMSGPEIQRASDPTTVAVDVSSGAITYVGSECNQALAWDKRGLLCATATQWGIDKYFQRIAADGKDREENFCRPTKWVWYGTVGKAWRARRREQPVVDVMARSGWNSPPSLYYRSRGQRRYRVLLNLNPQFKNIKLAKERLVTWEWSKGQPITGGLYFPVRYRSGERYPLVIQTHGFDSDVDNFQFWGASTTSDAAQPLAGRGMFVLQVPDMSFRLEAGHSPRGQLMEARRAMAIYRSAISYLSDRGMVDPKKVGIIGWSHTVFFVKWALTHHPAMFAAATVAEGGDGSYLQYILDMSNDIADESLYTGPPFGKYLGSWMQLSPSFLMNRVQTPLLLVVLHNYAALEQWEWLDGLRDLERPVEMLVLDGRAHDSHELQEPWDQEIVSGGNVDWFDFWLNGHEDPSPAKADQYSRWRHLRALQEEARRNGTRAVISWTSVESTMHGM